MNSQYGVIIVGAGISGCFAALKAAKQGIEVLIVEQEAFPKERPFVEFLLARDFKYLGLDHSRGYFANQGFAIVAGSKIVAEVDMPEGYGYMYMEGNLLLSKLLEMVQCTKEITLINSAKVVDLIEKNGQYEGVKLSTSQNLYSKVIILCTGLNSITHFRIGAKHRWPTFFNKYKRKVKVATRIYAEHNTINQRFRNISYWFYVKGLFDVYILYPFDEYVACEACLADTSEEEALLKLNQMLQENLIAKTLLKGFNLTSLDYYTRVFTEFGVRLPTHFPGLLIAGEAMNLAGPVYLYSLYSSIHTGMWAGEVAGKIAKQNNVEYSLFEDYEKVWLKNLVELKNDFEIMNRSSDQFDALGNWQNALLEDFDKYFLPIEI